MDEVVERRRTPLLAAAALIVVAGAGFGGGYLTGINTAEVKPAASSKNSGADAKPAVGEVIDHTSEPEPEPTYMPTADDFALKAKITDRACFGSAGCNIDYEVELTYLGTEMLDPSLSYDITYEVAGVEDGPAIGTLTVTGEKYTVEEDFAETKSAATELKVTVTDVSDGY